MMTIRLFAGFVKPLTHPNQFVLRFGGITGMRIIDNTKSTPSGLRFRHLVLTLLEQKPFSEGVTVKHCFQNPALSGGLGE